MAVIQPRAQKCPLSSAPDLGSHTSGHRVRAHSLLTQDVQNPLFGPQAQAPLRPRAFACALPGARNRFPQGLYMATSVLSLGSQWKHPSTRGSNRNPHAESYVLGKHEGNATI